MPVLEAQIGCPECGTVFQGASSVDEVVRCPHPECRAELPELEGVSYEVNTDLGVLSLSVQVLSGDAPAEHRLSGPGPWWVGSGTECDVRLNNMSVRPRHVRIQLRDDGFSYAEPGPEEEGPETRLFSGRALSVGTVQVKAWVRFSFAAADTGPSPTLFILPEPIDLSALGADGGSLLIGRNRNEVGVALPVRRVSRTHALLRREGGALYVHDLQSRHGVFLNGVRIVRRRLETNDVVSFGPCSYRFDGRKLWLVRITGASLQLRGVSYRPARASSPLLKDISLAVRPNEFLGILGPSGSGKTTLLKVMASYLKPMSGEICVDGDRLDAISLQEFRRSIAYVPQEDILHDTLTVEQEIRYASELRLGGSIDPDRVQHCGENALQQVQLPERRALQIRKLSGGQRRRVNLAVELVSRPCVMFMDEPTSGLDPGTEADMMRLFRRIADQGCTTICTTHIMENIELFDRMAVLARGEIVYFGPPHDLLREFGIQRYTDLYRKLQSEDTSTYAARVQADEQPDATREERFEAPEDVEKPWEALRQLKVLSLRYARELVSDGRFLFLLVLQPVVIGWLLRAANDGDDMKLLFFCVVAAFWFGLTNAAREIVGEDAVVRRELMVGISPPSFLGGKAVVLWICALLQACLLVLVVSVFQPLLPSGGYGEFVLVLFLVSAVGTMMGLAVSTHARTVLQAIALVPLITIPHLVFTQKVFEVKAGGSLRGVLVTFNAVEYGYKWLKDIHDTTDACVSRTSCWCLGGWHISYAFLALVFLIAALFCWAWFVLRRRYLSAE